MLSGELESYVGNDGNTRIDVWPECCDRPLCMVVKWVKTPSGYSRHWVVFNAGSGGRMKLTASNDEATAVGKAVRLAMKHMKNYSVSREAS